MLVMIFILCYNMLVISCYLYDIISCHIYYVIYIMLYYVIQLGHWLNEQSVRQWSVRRGFNPRSSHTKDLKNGT